MSGGRVAGVKTGQIHTWGTHPDVGTADYWAAMDVLGNMRILKAAIGGTVVFTASATITPPIRMPKSVQIGQSWNVQGTTGVGNWQTVISTNATFQGLTGLLQIQAVGTFDVDYGYYRLGRGPVAEHWFDGPTSGWTLR